MMRRKKRKQGRTEAAKRRGKAKNVPEGVGCWRSKDGDDDRKTGKK